jgi:hypothetical protein
VQITLIARRPVGQHIRLLIFKVPLARRTRFREMSMEIQKQTRRIDPKNGYQEKWPKREKPCSELLRYRRWLKA